MKHVLWLDDPAVLDAALSGGKGANLGRLIQRTDACVPGGFVVTTDAFRQICSGGVTDRIEALAQWSGQEREREAERLRLALRTACLPEGLRAELDAALDRFPAGTRFAVRSSATAEDLPDASFAGQQDSYLNVARGGVPAAVLGCFASLCSESAVAYRARTGLAGGAAMAVVVQEMVDAEVSGVLFTADPMTSDRAACVVEAVRGLGEGLVSGRRPPFTWRVRENAVSPASGAGAPLDDGQVLALAALGKGLEAEFGMPLDVEWCVRDGIFYVVQARAVTTLFPVPESGDGVKRFFVSFGHMQMMTDVILPLGMSFVKRIALFRTVECGGRLYIDITHDMKTVFGRKMIRTKLSAADPLLYGAVRKVMARRDYLRGIPKGPGSFSGLRGWLPMVRAGLRIYRRGDPAVIDAYAARMEASNAALEHTLAPLSGAAALQAILDDRQRLFGVLHDPEGFGMVLATQLVLRRIDRVGKRLTGAAHVSGRLSRAVEHNPSSEMGLALTEVADALRGDHAAAAYLEGARTCFSMDELRRISAPAADAFEGFLKRYGMRAPGEIDLSKPRFREAPGQLLGPILADLRTLPDGYGRASFLEGRRVMETLTQELVALAEQTLGRRGAGRLRRDISFLRSFAGTREYPKYFWVCRCDLYKQALQRTAEQLAAEGVLRAPGDLYYLYLEEVQELLRTGKADQGRIERRKADYRRFALLTPPRLISSDGEVPAPEGRKDLPGGALAGLGVSAGVAEGRARVVRSIGEAAMEPGDILVTAFTDPSWTPVFPSLAGLVTEVGGMMTHGAVVTREYGLPAVVGVADATRLIRDGARIRIDGERGFVQIVSDR